MSRLFGPIIQQGYVVPDLEEGMRHWLERGVGPFLVIPSVRIEGEHYGKRTETHITAAFAMSGDQQIELIQPHADSGPNIYSDFLQEHPDGGLQHVAVWSEDVDAQMAQLRDKGVRFIVGQRHYGTHAYLDIESSPGVMIQLMPTHQRYLELFERAKKEAETWDGQSDPVRVMAWDD
ncbi:MAG: VOC family protein [Alphaproteobacteria bacterium]|nr:VOC family protein [Alphaproteobacteria bacterium]